MEKQEESIRYDRQLRLWGDEGQSSIKEASVCVFGSSALCSEILKNLVLAGVGSFLVVDDALVVETDLGQNFFVTEADLGKHRGEAVVRNLLELNPSVRGNFSPLIFNNYSLDSLLDFSLVISTNLTERDAEQLSAFLFDKNIYYVHTRVCGMFGYLRLSFKQHTVWNSHPENPPHDFRLSRPFEELVNFADKLDLDSMEHETHAHTPYLLLYLKALEKWDAGSKQELFSSNYKKRKEFEQLLMGMRKEDDKGSLDEENFAEAKTNLLKSISGCKMTEEVQRVLDDPQASQVTLDLLAASGDDVHQLLRPFWIFSAALRHFFERHQLIPLSGALPDMTSHTAPYVQLLSIYRKKAAEDAAEVFEIAKQVYHQRLALVKQVTSNAAGKSTSSATDEGSRMSISSEPFAQQDERMQVDQETNGSDNESNGSIGLLRNGLTEAQCQRYCKNASKIAVQKGVPLGSEYERGLGSVLKQISDPDLTSVPVMIDPLVWFVLMRAMDRFQMEKDRFPGTNGVPCAIDSKDLKRRVDSLIADTKNEDFIKNSEQLIPHQAIDEICRYGAAEPHVVCTMVGGVVAQEVIKLVTHQYLPVDNAHIFDGHSQTSKSFRV